MATQKSKQADILKRIGVFLDSGLCGLDPLKEDPTNPAGRAWPFIQARRLLDGLLEPVPVPAPKPASPVAVSGPSSAKTIESLSVSVGKFTRQFDRENPKAVSAAENTGCKTCGRPLKLGRILPFHIGSKTVGYAHYACAVWIHAADCPCLSCANRRARAGKPLNFTGKTKMLPPQNMEQLLGQKVRAHDAPAVVAAKAALANCACGHRPDCHKEDELENLLGCQMQGCACDHFHYQQPAADKFTVEVPGLGVKMQTISAAGN